MTSPISTVHIDHRNGVRVHTPRIASRLEQARAVAAALAATEIRGAKVTWTFTQAAKNRFESAAFDLDYAAAGWSMLNPPRMLTLVLRGRESTWTKVAPTPSASSDLVKIFASRFESAYGEKLNAILGQESQKYGNPHFHLLLTVPVDAEGVERRSAHAVGRGGRYAGFNDLTFWEWVDMTWADVTGQKFDLSNPLRIGRNSHIPQAEDVPAAASMLDYVARFVQYIRKDGAKFAGKQHQHIVPAPWQGKQMSWWGIIGFRKMRRAHAAPVLLECKTMAADTAMRKFLARRSGRNAVYRELDGELVDVSIWSHELRGGSRTGGTFERPLAAEEVRVLRRLITFYNGEPNVPEECAMSEQQAYEAAYPTDQQDEFPPRINKNLQDARWSAPAPWEREDFDRDAFEAWATHETNSADFPAGTGADDNVLPTSALLELMGFTADEQDLAARAATRRNQRFIFSETD